MQIEHAVPKERAQAQAHLVAALNSTIVDFVARTKILGNHASWYMLEQLPFVRPEKLAQTKFGDKSASDLVRESVLELTYTSHDMAQFARDLGHVDDGGILLPIFSWDEERRQQLRAKLDAMFFHLYGVTDRDDVRYIYSTFPIVEREEIQAHGRYRSRDLCLAWMNALAAGNTDASIAI